MNYKIFTFSFRVDEAGTLGDSIALTPGFYAMGAGYSWVPDTYGSRFQLLSSTPNPGWSSTNGTGWQIAGRFNGPGVLQFYVCAIDGVTPLADGVLPEDNGGVWEATPASPAMPAPDAPAPPPPPPTPSDARPAVTGHG